MKCSSCGKGRLRLKHPPFVYECDACKVGTVGPGRLRCLVPFCGHERGPRKGDTGPFQEGEEWICHTHWMSLPKKYRRLHTRIWRQINLAVAKNSMVREYWKMPVGDERTNAWLLWSRRQRIWTAIKKAAIERGMGI